METNGWRWADFPPLGKPGEDCTIMFHDGTAIETTIDSPEYKAAITPPHKTIRKIATGDRSLCWMGRGGLR